MASDLLSIAASGVRAARVALDVTANNIANADSAGYVRRNAVLEEMRLAGGRSGDVSLAGVRVDGVLRNADVFRQAEVRRTGADAARAGAEIAGLEGIESALELAGVHPAIAGFEASLQRLSAAPADPALRAMTLADAGTLARAFNAAAAGLSAVGEGLRGEAQAGTDRVNVLTAGLARINQQLGRAANLGNDQSMLLDQRDQLLEELSGYADVSVSIAANQTVELRLGGAGGPVMLTGATALPLAMTTAGDGTIAFTLDGNPVSLAAGALAGKSLALSRLATTHTELDTLAGSIIAIANTAQANGATLDGSAGQPMFAGATAADMAVALNDGAGLATAPAGSPAGSRDGANLMALRAALGAANPAGGADALLFDVSTAISGRKLTQGALVAIAEGARGALAQSAGVDLDREALNLVRFQQAFQASGKVMQVASDLFDTLFGIG